MAIQLLPLIMKLVSAAATGYSAYKGAESSKNDRKAAEALASSGGGGGGSTTAPTGSPASFGGPGTTGYNITPGGSGLGSFSLGNMGGGGMRPQDGDSGSLQAIMEMIKRLKGSQNMAPAGGGRGGSLFGI